MHFNALYVKINMVILMEETKKKRFLQKDSVKRILFISVRVIVIAILVLNVVFYFFTENDDARSRMIFNGLMALVLLILSLIPSIMEHAWKIDIPSYMEIIFLIFATLAFLFGEIGDFYIKFSWWDTFLHTMSGGLIACVGFVLLNLLSDEKKSIKIPPIFAAIFVFCFSIACGAVWEMIEWVADTINGTNMQRFRDNITEVPFEGRDALFDTMKDLFLDAIGALVVSIIGYFDIKYNHNFMLNTFKVEKVESKKKIKNKENEFQEEIRE